MNFKYNEQLGVKVTTLFEGEKLESELFNYVSDKKLFSNKVGEVYSYLPFDGEKQVLAGLGDKDLLDYDDYRVVYFNVAKELLANKEGEFTISVDCKKVLEAALEGLFHATYTFDKYKSDKVEVPKLQVGVVTKLSEAEFNEVVAEVKDTMGSVFFARDLVNERAEYLYPETLANIAVEQLTPYGVDVEVYDEKQCEEMGLKAFLSVGRGSERKPRFIVMKYFNNPESKEITGLVGKGVTYDTGGYSLKPSTSMDTMHCDMGGAGTMIGAIQLIAKRKVKANVVAVVAACENMVSGISYKPGDVISSLSGKTIEVDNTDAEGRITLADAVFYTTKELGVTRIIDAATLTGACVVALGEVYTGSISNNQEFFNSLQTAANESGERLWQMPIDNSYRKLNKSSVADVKNTGGRYGGMITAGLFIENFLADKNIPWIHLDIAGTAYITKQDKYMVPGATGIHVKTLYKLVK